MPKFTVTAPDGASYTVNAPEGATEADAIAYVQKNIHQSSVPEPKSSAVSFGSALNQVPRQVGLFGRSIVEGLPTVADAVTEPVRNLIVNPALRALNVKEIPSVADSSRGLADAVGLPKPETPTERVVMEANKMASGGFGGVKAASTLARETPGVLNFVSENAAPVVESVKNKVISSLASNPASQVASAAGAGGASQASREAGGSPWQQLNASILGSLGGHFAPDAANVIKNAGSQLLKSKTPQDLDVQINSVLARSGIDYSKVPERIRQTLRDDLASAMKIGPLNPENVRRLIDFKMSGMTPTQGMLTLDPVQITKEQNLAKMAANMSDDGLHGLPRLLNQNNTQLVTNLNDLGATRGNLFGAGESAINSIAGKDARMGKEVGDLYTQARGLPGGNVQLDRRPVVDNIFNELAKSGKIAFLPENVSSMLNQISQGQIKANGQIHPVPFDANTLDTLMTTIATAQRGTTDGNVKAALSAVRKAIDGAPIQPLKQEFGNSQVVTPAVAGAMQTADGAPQQFMEALNKARSAARDRFSWQESGRPIEAALNGEQPDNFIKKFVINGTRKDAEDLAKNAPVEPIRNAIVAHLKEVALNGSADEVGKFSQSAYNKELKRLIQSGKLPMFFDKEEISKLEAMGRAASYMQAQPVGSAVNNSNSGALIMGRAHDFLKAVPLVGDTVAPALKGLDIKIGNKRAANVVPGLLDIQQTVPRGASAVLPLGIGGMGLLTQP